MISDSLTVFDPTGAIFAQVSSAEDSTEDNTVISFIVPGLVGVDPTQFTKSTILLEPGGNALNGPYSDVFGVALVQGVFVLGFESDSEIGGPPVDAGPPSQFPNATYLQETNGLFDATLYLSVALQDLGYRAVFQSDLDAQSVPEPATLTLLGLGALGLAGYAWRRKKQLLSAC